MLSSDLEVNRKEESLICVTSVQNTTADELKTIDQTQRKNELFKAKTPSVADIKARKEKQK